MSALALNLIRQAKIENWTTLDLGNTNLNELPQELFELEKLEKLILSNGYWDIEHKKWIVSSNKGDKTNLKGEIPKDIQNLKNLKHLYLSGDDIESALSDITELKNLTNLLTLDISNNKKVKDFSILKNLTNLTSLNFNNNQIDDISFLKSLTNLTTLYLNNNKHIKEFNILKNLTNLLSLDLSYNQIKSINFLENLTNLHTLNLSNNQVININSLKKLTKLTYLNLDFNNIKNILPLKYLINLISLDISNNQVTDICALKNLTNFTFINLNYNQIKDISPLLPFIEKEIPIEIDRFCDSAINLTGNPLEVPSIEIIRKGNRDIIKFFEKLENSDEVIYEARLVIIGEAGSGKTTFSRKIKNIKAKMPNSISDATTGINIDTQVFKGNFDQKPFKMYVWDFGGQGIYQATHQFFLSKNSLYVLLVDGRREENFDYWLQVQELLGKDSPVLIVFNQKGNNFQNIPINEIKHFYPNVRNDFQVDLKNDLKKIKILQGIIEYHIRNLPHLIKEERIPKSGIRLRHELSLLKKDYISLFEFRNICKNVGLNSRERQNRIIDYLHDLGVILYFKDIPSLNKLVILNLEWATKAVYKILDHTKQIKTAGHFTRQELNIVWSGKEYEDCFDDLLLLMERFELCFPLPENKNKYIVPELLPIDKPFYDWDNHNNLQLVFKYDFLPKGIVARLIVRLHRYIENKNYIWKRGAVFSWDGTRIEVLENPREKQISVKAKGLNTREWISIISKEIDEINSIFHFNDRMKVKKLVPCNCHYCKHQIVNGGEPNFYEYKKLINRLQNDKDNIECEFSYKEVKIQQLILNVFTDSPKRPGEKKFKAFVSYSKNDINFKDRLKMQLRLYERRGQLELWDDCSIDSGKEWQKEIIEHLENDDFIFLLISPDFIATDYIWNVEIPKALERHLYKEAKVIPIILRPCSWEQLGFSYIQALPEKGVPITKWTDQDEAWLSVEKGIEKVLGQL